MKMGVEIEKVIKNKGGCREEDKGIGGDKEIKIKRKNIDEWSKV